MKMKVGDAVIIRCVVYHYIGRVESITQDEVELSSASWLAESARWSETLKTGKVNEVEPYPDWVVIARQSIMDYAPWVHELPTEPK